MVSDASFSVASSLFCEGVTDCDAEFIELLSERSERMQRTRVVTQGITIRVCSLFIVEGAEPAKLLPLLELLKVCGTRAT